MISWSSSTASSAPATSLNVTLGESTLTRLARLLPKLITLEPPPCIWFMMKIQKAKMRTSGMMNVMALVHHGDLGLLDVTWTSGCSASRVVSWLVSG